MSEENLSPFLSLPLHDTWFDWSDETLTAKSISRRLMGNVDHWDDPMYEGMEPHEIEREILFEAGRDAWAFRSAHGKPYYQHFLILMCLLDEETDITPTIADATRLFCMSFAYGIKAVNLIGSQNAGKSAGSVRIAFCCFYIDPEYTAIYVANPFNNTADSTVWGDVLEMWDNICTTHPHPDKERATYLFPDGYVYQDRYITAMPKLAKAGFIKLQDPKKESKFKGSKTRKSGGEGRGVIIHVVDEINEIGDFSYLNVLPNLQSQDGFICLDSQNFKSEDDMGGAICQPVQRYDDDVSSYEDLDVETSHVWSSAYSSVTLRFDGKRAANMQAGRVIYRYLFKQADWDRLAESGMESDTFYSQARSFPIRGEEVGAILSKSTVSKSQHKDRWFTKLGQHVRVSFCDPAFGGKDKAKWGFAEYGLAIVKDAEGNNERINLFQVNEYFKTLKFVNGAVYNDYWVNRMAEAGIRDLNVTMGADVSAEDQVAIQCAELNQQYGISEENFGYDYSMRADMIVSMTKFVGDKCIAFDYNKDPEGFYLESYKTNTTDYCYDRVTELCYIMADLFNSRQFRGGDFCEQAIVQLSRTKFDEKGKKKKAMNKKEYKANWKQKSPDDRDLLIGLGGVAAKRGMSTKILKSANKSDSSSDHKIRRKFRAKKARRI